MPKVSIINKPTVQIDLTWEEAELLYHVANSSNQGLWEEFGSSVDPDTTEDLMNLIYDGLTSVPGFPSNG